MNYNFGILIYSTGQHASLMHALILLFLA